MSLLSVQLFIHGKVGKKTFPALSVCTQIEVSHHCNSSFSTTTNLRAQLEVSKFILKITHPGALYTHEHLSQDVHTHVQSQGNLGMFLTSQLGKQR